MIFIETSLPGAYLVELEPVNDERGFFARTWCAKEFAAQKLTSTLVQCNLSSNINRGTLRGLHYQCPPHEEAKLVTCISGALYDVILDIRRHSPTFGKWQAFELSAETHRAVYIPEGFAHGFQTLTDNTKVFYQMTAYFQPEYARGIRWNDPLFAIDWPLKTKIISSKDQTYRWWSD